MSSGCRLIDVLQAHAWLGASLQAAFDVRAALAVTTSARCCLHEGIYSNGLIQQLAEIFLEIGSPGCIDCFLHAHFVPFLPCRETPGRLPPSLAKKPLSTVYGPSFLRGRPGR